MFVFKFNELPAISVNFDTYLYLTAKHTQTQTPGSVYFFYLFRNGETTSSAIFQCVEGSEDSWLSPAKAPFGGIQCDAKCKSTEISFLLNCAEQWITNKGGKKLTIKNAPFCYNERTKHLLSEYYKNNNYAPSKVYDNHFINITGDYAQLIQPAERRRLRKCKSAGFIGELYEYPDTELVYSFLLSCRSEKNYDISMTIVELGNLLLNFPEDAQVFIVKHQLKIIALTVTIRVNKSILYNFLPASLSAYNHYSPSVMLMETVYKYCLEQQISVLDLGSSLDKSGEEKASLIRFKENIGGIRSYKATYEKVLQI